MTDDEMLALHELLTSLAFALIAYCDGELPTARDYWQKYEIRRERFFGAALDRAEKDT